MSEEHKVFAISLYPIPFALEQSERTPTAKFGAYLVTVLLASTSVNILFIATGDSVDLCPDKSRSAFSCYKM